LKTTGTGPFTYRVRPIELPAPIEQHLGAAHSSFVPDRALDGGDDSTWFSLKGVGLLRLTPELDRIDVIGGDATIVQSNIHGATVIRHEGQAYLALASDEAERVWLTDTDGRIVRTFGNPDGQGESPFNVCDVAYSDELLFAANGYSDNVISTCDPFQASSDQAGQARWEPLRFGGDGTDHGRFQVAHGITRVPGTTVLTVADRENARLESFTSQGRYVGGLPLPPGARPCSVDYYDRFALVACLEGPSGSTPAPIYVFDDGNLVSEINIGRDLGLAGFTHIHNAAFRVVENGAGAPTFFVLAYAWEPGNLAILEPA
jgi:hypothetical protein